jgi:hypothetical protein
MNPKDKETKEEELRTEIRTSLTYALPAGIIESEWTVIINNVESLMARQRKEELSKLKEKIEETINNINEEGHFVIHDIPREIILALFKEVEK